MQENIEKMHKWVIFVDTYMTFGISKDRIIKLILYSSTNNNRKLTVIYPQCLQIFLLSNLNRHFVFKKLYMTVSHNLRYSWKNLININHYSC